MQRLRDVIAPGLDLLFVGINPGLRSSEIGHHFGGKANPFWKLLHAAGLTSKLLVPEEDRRLLEWRLGLTNLCARPSRAASDLEKSELREGLRLLERKVRNYGPARVALVGITIYNDVFPRNETPGPGAKPEAIAGVPLFVVPNPSGLNASFPGFAQKLVWFEALRDWVRAGRAAPR